MEIKFQKISDFAVCPSRNTETDAGYDLYSTTSYSINPLERKLVSTGIKIHIPEGYYGRIAPRSGLAVKKGLDVMAGVIDSGYRGELRVLLVNITPYAPSKTPYENFFGTFGKIDIKQGDRIAQIIIEKCYSAEWKEVEQLEDSERNEGGFGSSGV
jgi:dUTP pyrophosphatase